MHKNARPYIPFFRRSDTRPAENITSFIKKIFSSAKEKIQRLFWISKNFNFLMILKIDIK